MPDLEAGIADLQERLGAAPLHGGRHKLLGTWNAILPLEGGSYLELIAADPEAPEPAGPRPFGIDDLDGPRLVTWAVRTTGLDAAVARARERGFDPGAIVPVTRETPDGERLEWRLTIRLEPAASGLVPFLIDWGAAPHPSGAAPPRCRITEFDSVHPDPDTVGAMLDALDVSLAVGPGDAASLRATLAGPGKELRLRG